MSADVYDSLKALHIIAFTAWMAGLFYLPRLFVYHTRLQPAEKSYAMFCEMERKLLAIIMMPAAIVTWILGLLLSHAFIVDATPPIWLVVKLVAVIAMTAFHWRCAQHARDFSAETNRKAERYFRIFNEVPTILLIVIVFSVVFKF